MSISRVAIIGAGILGIAAANEVTRRLPEAEVTIFDKAATIAAHQSGHTSGIIDSGLDQIPGSKAAKLARRGVQKLVPFMAERGVPYRECGQLLIAQNTDEAERLEELFARAKDNEIPGARLLERHEIAAVEPAARGVLGLFAPHAAVADFAALTEALAADVRADGGAFRLNTEVTGFDVMSNKVRLRGRAVPQVPKQTVRDDRSSADDADEQVHERPRTYRTGQGRDPVIGIGDELRDRFGEQDWFKQAESAISGWTEKLSNSWSRGSEARTRRADVAEEVLGAFDIVIVCAGLHADRLAAAAGLDPEPRIVPFTCDYYRVPVSGAGAAADANTPEAGGASASEAGGPSDSEAGRPGVSGSVPETVRGIIGTVPDPHAPFAETSVIRGIDDALVLGPNTFVGLGREAYDRRGFDLGDIGSTARFKGFWKFAAQTAKTAARGVKTVVSKSAFIDEVRRIVPGLDAATVEEGTRGVRAQAMNDDGELVDDLIATTRGRLTVVRSVPKWGATSALAIAEDVVDQALAAHTR